jgi:hypothetical protein
VKTHDIFIDKEEAKHYKGKLLRRSCRALHEDVERDNRNYDFGDLAQLARASDSYSLGPGFESLNRHHLKEPSGPNGQRVHSLQTFEAVPVRPIICVTSIAG